MSTYTNQSARTRTIMDVIRKYRLAQNEMLPALVENIARQGFALTPGQYQAMEDGRTRNIPVDLVIGLAVHLGIPAHELFPELDS